MKYINFYLPYFTFLFFTFLGLLIWDLIKININPLQDFIRFYTYILISLVPTYFVIKNNWKNIYPISEIFTKTKNTPSIKSDINFLYYFFIILIILSFLTLEPKEFYNLDLYHDGFSLTPSMNFLLTNKLTL